MFWFLGANFACATTELADMQFQSIFSTGFTRHHSSADFPHLHYHLNCELFFVNQGQCTVQCAGRDYICSRSDILLVNDGVWHRRSHLSQGALAYSLQFSFSPSNKQDLSFYDRLLSKISSPVLLRGQDHLLSTLNLIRREFALQQSLYDTTIDALLQVFYTQLLRSLLDDPAPSLPQPFTINPPKTRTQLFDIVPQAFYKAILDSFFNSHPLQQATLAALSGNLRLSEVQTRRVVKQYYGVSYQERLIQAKIERSKFLIASTDLSLKEVAEQCGYGSYHAFFKAFTARTGQTPSEYRKTNYQKAIPPAEGTQSH